MTIISEMSAVSEHPQQNLKLGAEKKLLIANMKLKKIQASRSVRIMRVLECMLQVTGITLTSTQIGTVFFTELIQKFIGLLLRGEILKGTKARTEDYARHLGSLHDKVFILNSISPRVQLGTIMSRKNLD